MNGRTSRLLRQAARLGPVLAPLKTRKRALKRRWLALNRHKRAELREQLFVRIAREQQ